MNAVFGDVANIDLEGAIHCEPIGVVEVAIAGIEGPPFCQIVAIGIEFLDPALSRAFIRDVDIAGPIHGDPMDIPELAWP